MSHESLWTLEGCTALPSLLTAVPRLVQILRGVDNPLARAAARGEETEHLLPAAALDLGALGRLAVSDAQLADWVNDTVPGLPREWHAAVSSLRSAAGSPHQNGAAGAHFRLPEQPPPALLAPLSAVGRVAARGLLAGRPLEEAVGDVVSYYASYGVGLLPSHRWGRHDRLAAQRQCVERGSLSQSSSAGQGCGCWADCLLLGCCCCAGC